MTANSSFKREIDALTEVFRFTGDFAEREGLGEAAVFALNLSVEELFTNIVKYGDPKGRDVGIELGVRDGHLVVEVVDEDGGGFDPTAQGRVDVDKKLEERREGGLGIHLIRHIMDYVRYECDGRRAVVTLKKRLEEPHV